MNEKRFKGYAEKTGQHYELIIQDGIGEEYNITDDFHKSKDIIFEIVDLLNAMNESLIKLSKNVHKLSEANVDLKEQLKQKEQEERLYANEILKLNKEAKEVLDFKSLGGDY